MSVPESTEALFERVLARVAELEAALVERDRVIAEQGERIAELERRLGQDSANSSRPPSSDAPWDKKSAKKRSSRGRSGRKPGKQPGASSSSRSLVDDPDLTVVIEPERCRGCESLVADAAEAGRERRQVVDVGPVPPPEITEYQRVSKICTCCGTVTIPGWDQVRDDDPRRDVVAGPGSPVRIGPETLARATLLTCGHFLPVGRARQLLEALTGVDVSTGFLAGVRGRAARRLEKRFLGHVRGLLAGAPVLHAGVMLPRFHGLVGEGIRSDVRVVVSNSIGLFQLRAECRRRRL